MLTILEYVVAVGGSLALFFITKVTNMGVRHFTPYMCLLIAWSIVMYLLLHLIYKAKQSKS